MLNEVPVIKSGERSFVDLPKAAKLAILLPTARWSPMSRAVIGSMVGVANEEITVLVSDNSENPDKRVFLKRICEINPNIIAVSQEKNIGAKGNWLYLYDWSKGVEFSAIMADDDWMSPTYHQDAYEALLKNPTASTISAGSTLVDFGDGRLHNVDQPSMRGATPLERIRQWNAIAARVTMYNVSYRSHVDAAIEFIRATPLLGLTLTESLWELNRLALGEFLTLPGPGCFLHYPEHGAHTGDSSQRFYRLICEEVGLKFPFVYFTALSSAVLCGMFLGGNHSPIADPTQRELCGQQAFGHIFRESFLPKMSGESSQAAAEMLFANHPAALAGFKKFCNPQFAANPVFNKETFDWFVELVRIFETPDFAGKPLLSQQFLEFAREHVSF